MNCPCTLLFLHEGMTLLLSIIIIYYQVNNLVRIIMHNCITIICTGVFLCTFSLRSVYGRVLLPYYVLWEREMEYCAAFIWCWISDVQHVVGFFCTLNASRNNVEYFVSVMYYWNKTQENICCNCMGSIQVNMILLQSMFPINLSH